MDIIYLDFQKTFDKNTTSKKVPHERLLLDLKSHGMETNLNILKIIITSCVMELIQTVIFITK